MNLFQLLSILGIGLSVVVCLGHFVILRPRRGAPALEPRNVRRYGLWERLIHLVLLVSFLVLLVTSFGPVLRGLRMGGYGLMLHTAAGAAFAVSVAAMMVTWAVDACFAKHDRGWLRTCGCLGARVEGLPIGRFDTAAKMYFWLAGLLGLSTLLTMMLSMVPLFGTAGQWTLLGIHRYSALVLVMATIVHTYRTTLGKPGGWGAMLSGRVSGAWARHYHALWADELKARGPAKPK